MIHPYEVREVICTGGMAERKSAYPHQTMGLTMDVRIIFLTAQPPLPLAPVFLFIESGIGIGTANHLPLTGEPQKVVRTAEAGEECPYVSVRTSRIGIYRHTSLVGLRLVHAFSQFPLSLFHFVESGTGIGTANHLPLTSEPQKAVRTAEAGEECLYVSVRTSRIGIYGHTSFVELRLVHAF